MKKPKLLFLVTLLSVLSCQLMTVAQTTRQPYATWDSRNRIVKLSDLAGDVSACGRPSVNSGAITSIQYNGDTPTRLTLRMKNGRRKNVYLETMGLSNAEMGKLYTIIKEGKRVRISVYVCGSGGIWQADKIEAL